MSLALQYVNYVTDIAPVPSFAVCKLLSLIGLLSLALQYLNCITDTAPVPTLAVCEFNHW